MPASKRPRDFTPPAELTPEEGLSEWSGVPELAAWLGVSVETVYQWNTRDRGPRRTRIGKYVRYRRRDIEAWIAQQYDDAA